ncbi:MAG: phosphoglucosamine mutase [Burkholderiales bacterium]|nr:phosphoglucosamine mutase [Burkholderiales bacterium]
MGRKYFGTDGVRGRVGDAPITADFVLRLGYAAGKVLASRSHAQWVHGPGGDGRGHTAARPSVIVGKDTRLSGYMLEAALEAGFAAAGVDVALSGPIPTPAIAYLTRALRLSAGVVISASHNPYEDNGIKFFSADGNKLPDEVEAEIEAQLEQPIGCVGPDALGRARRIDDAAGRYIEFCKSTFPNELDLYGMRLVVDCAHGAAYHTAPHVFHELGADVVTIGAQPNGLNINDGCGATHPQALAAAVLEHRADLGIAVDGDADRLIMADANGRIYNGDELLYAIVRDRLMSGPVAGAVGTLMSNLGLEQALARLSVGFARAKVGDRYVLEMLREKGWRYGGESSGHLLCLDRHSTGDGTISALQVLSAICRSGIGLAQLCADLQMFPQTLINVRIAKGFDWNADTSLARARQEVERELGSSGRILIRPSGTEPLLRVMVEAGDAALAEQMAQRLAQAVQAAV